MLNVDSLSDSESRVKSVDAFTLEIHAYTEFNFKVRLVASAFSAEWKNWEKYVRLDYIHMHLLDPNTNRTQSVSGAMQSPTERLKLRFFLANSWKRHDNIFHMAGKGLVLVVPFNLV